MSGSGSLPARCSKTKALRLRPPLMVGVRRFQVGPSEETGQAPVAFSVSASSIRTLSLSLMAPSSALYGWMPQRLGGSSKRAR